MDKTTNTNLRIDTKIMDRFKNMLRKEGYRLHKGAERAFAEYIEKREEKKKSKEA
jgi:enolase